MLYQKPNPAHCWHTARTTYLLTMNTLLIIDVSNLAYRSAYAPELKTSQGRISGHIYHTVKSILALINTRLATLDLRLCFCYDGINSKQIRQAILPEYKGNRTPHDFNPMPEVTSLLKLWPGIHIEQMYYEGDDAIHFAVRNRKGAPCIVWSGDRDLWSLMATPGCSVFSPNLERFVLDEDVTKHYHLIGHPERIPLAKALFGDSSDNITGVERLMKKHVSPILGMDTVCDVESFYAALGYTKPNCMTANTFSKLIANKEKVLRNYQVILPQLQFEKSSVKVVKDTPETWAEIRKILVEFECFSVLPDIQRLQGDPCQK
jgi:5'-3' exonuclease